ncbi:MAG: hypothetical protein Q9169_008516, partial [Polycauliona sp. 2 TL-2023]
DQLEAKRDALGDERDRQFTRLENNNDRMLKHIKRITNEYNRQSNELSDVKKRCGGLTTDLNPAQAESMVKYNEVKQLTKQSRENQSDSYNTMSERCKGLQRELTVAQSELAGKHGEVKRLTRRQESTNEGNRPTMETQAQPLTNPTLDNSSIPDRRLTASDPASGANAQGSSLTSYEAFFPGCADEDEPLIPPDSDQSYQAKAPDSRVVSSQLAKRTNPKTPMVLIRQQTKPNTPVTEESEDDERGSVDEGLGHRRRRETDEDSDSPDEIGRRKRMKVDLSMPHSGGVRPPRQGRKTQKKANVGRPVALSGSEPWIAIDSFRQATFYYGTLPRQVFDLVRQRMDFWDTKRGPDSPHGHWADGAKGRAKGQVKCVNSFANFDGSDMSLGHTCERCEHRFLICVGVLQGKVQLRPRLPGNRGGVSKDEMAYWRRPQI